MFLAGDAAHAMTPHMAQGACSAMRDGINLAWKLDLVLRGQARPDLLDSYEPERQTHVIPLVQGSLATWAMATELDPEKAAARDAFLRTGVTPPSIPPLTTGILHRNGDGSVVAPAGSLSPQGRVRFNGGEDLLDNLVGFGFQLISSIPLDNVLAPELRTRLTELGVKILTLGEGDGQVQDLNDTYAAFLAEKNATAYISRPDFYLFGVANGADATTGLVDELLAQLPSVTLAMSS